MRKDYKLIEEIKTLTVLELADMVKALEEEFGVVAAAPVVAAGAAAGPSRRSRRADRIQRFT